STTVTSKLAVPRMATGRTPAAPGLSGLGQLVGLMSTETARAEGGLVGTSGPSGGGKHVPSAFVTLITRSVWVAYRQPSGPTAAKSPRLPPVKMSVNVGGVVVRSIFVMIPSFRLTYRNGAVASADTAIPSIEPKGVSMMVTAPGVAEFVPVITATPQHGCQIAAKSVPSEPNASPSAMIGA